MPSNDQLYSTLLRTTNIARLLAHPMIKYYKHVEIKCLVVREEEWADSC